MITKSNMLSKPSSHSIGESVYYSLRKNIMILNLKPGESLNLKEISEQLNVSRTPVRDALNKLENEGLVDIIPQRGTSVSKIDLKRVEEERFLRQSLEVRAVSIFMQELRNTHVTALKNNLQIQKECFKVKDYQSFLEYDDQFHHVFFDAIEKNMCWETIQSMSGHYRRVRLMTLWDSNIFSSVIAQHQAIVKNIADNKVNTVLDLFVEHASKIVKEERILFEKYPDYFYELNEDNFLLKEFLRLKY